MPSKTPACPAFSPSDQALLAEVADLYKRQLHGDSPQGRHFLRRLGIRSNQTVKHFDLGYSDGKLPRKVSEDQLPALKALGLVCHNRKELWEEAIVFPVTDPDTNALVDLFAIKKHQRKRSNLFDPPRGLLNPAALTASEIILTEGPEEALKIFDCGWHAVVPLRSVSDLAANIDRFRGSHIRRVWLNSRAHYKDLEALLSPLGFEVVHLRLHPDYRTISADTLKSQMESAQALAPVRPRPDLIEVTANGAIYEQHGVRFKVEGLPCDPGKRGKLTWTASRGEAVHTDLLDLRSANNRKRFVTQGAEVLGIEPEKLAQVLLDLFGEIDRLIEDRARRKAITVESTAAREPLLTRDRREEALKILQSATLIESVLDDISRLGLVGERDNALLLYLVAVSRKLDRPLSAILRSESASGKSNLVERIVELLPEGDLLYTSRFSPTALYYMPAGSLANRLLVVEERIGSSASDYAVRVLQSKGSLTTAVPLPPDEGGGLRTKLITVQGPVSYIETTTAPDIDPQNLNRCFEVRLDESSEQTARILEERQRRRSITHERTARSTILERHRDMQNLLVPAPVLIPFAPLLTFPAQQVRYRRDHERLLGLIDASAMLHQHQREWRTTPRSEKMIVASREDYALAYRLCLKALAWSVDELSVHAREAWERVLLFKNAPFTRRQLMQSLKWPYSRAYMAIQELRKHDLLGFQPGRGREPATYLARSDAPTRPELGLLSPEKIPE